MALDRDLGVAWARAWSVIDPSPKRGWEMLAATGVRALRLLHESGRFTSMLSTEANPNAAALLGRNVERYAAEGALARTADAHSIPSEAPFDYVDLDPYGSPIPYLPSALAAVTEGGILGVSATDMTVLGGADPSACVRRYGGRPVRGELGPESGLRILLAALSREARNSGRTIRPTLAYVGDHHVRAYVRLVPVEAAHPDPISMVELEGWQGTYLPGPGPYGPMWTGPLLDPEWIARLSVPTSAADRKRTEQWIAGWKGEVSVDRPFYYDSNELAEHTGASAPAPVDRLIEELRARGFAAARTRTRLGRFRTTAPRSVVEEVARSVSHSQTDRVRAELRSARRISASRSSSFR